MAEAQLTTKEESVRGYSQTHPVNVWEENFGRKKNSLWEEAGLSGENPRLLADRWPIFNISDLVSNSIVRKGPTSDVNLYGFTTKANFKAFNHFYKNPRKNHHGWIVLSDLGTTSPGYLDVPLLWLPVCAADIMMISAYNNGALAKQTTKIKVSTTQQLQFNRTEQCFANIAV